MRMNVESREYIDVTNLEIQHLRELLENERRVVRLLSRVSNVDLSLPELSRMSLGRAHEPRERRSESMEGREMPILEVEGLEPQVEGPEDDEGEGGGQEKATAVGVYRRSGSFTQVLDPQLASERKDRAVSFGGDLRPDLEWYDEFIKSRGEKEPAQTKERESGARPKGDRYMPRMKPSSYDGQTPYEDYEVQFHMLADLNGWTDEVKALYLAGCLSGSARSVLNDMDPKARYNYRKLNEALRERFGTDDQSELFKAKLRNRVKSKDETLQELAHDVRRLVRLAYPKAPARTHNDLTKDQFIEALGDGEVRWSVFQARPKNITEALKVAMELEAFKESEKCRMRRSVRSIKEDGVETEVNKGDQDRPEILTQVQGVDLRQMAAQISQMSQGGPSYPGPRTRNREGGPGPDKGAVGMFRDGERNASSGFQGGRKEISDPSDKGYANPRPMYDTSRVKCFRCDELGHYARNCPGRKENAAKVPTEVNLNE
jgi:hypothetical protein